MKTAVIYTRVSTAEQARGTSLDTQESDCRAYCKRKGYDVAAVFQDAGESAKTAHRPGLQAAIAFCKKRKPSALVIWKLDRLARNTLDGLQIKAQLQAYGTAVESATEATEANESGDLISSILLSVAQFDNAQRAKRVTRGLQATAMSGGWVSCPPIGYITAPRASLAPCPATSAQVIQLFTAIASRTVTTTQAIESFKTSLLPRRACKSVIYALLRNPIYCGIIKTKCTGWQEVAAKFPGLVSHETFYAVQRVIKQRYQIIQKHNPGVPLRGLLHCSTCGRPLTGGLSTGRGGKKYAHYFCQQKGHSKISAIKAESEIIRILSQATHLTALLASFKGKACEYMKTDIEANRESRNAAQRNVDALEAKLDKMTDGWANGTLDEASYKRNASAIRERIFMEKEKAQEKEFDQSDFTRILDRVLEILSDPIATYHAIAPEKKIIFLEILFGGLKVTEKVTLETLNHCKPNIDNVLNKKITSDSEMVDLVGRCTCPR